MHTKSEHQRACEDAASEVGGVASTAAPPENRRRAAVKSWVVLSVALLASACSSGTAARNSSPPVGILFVGGGGSMPEGALTEALDVCRPHFVLISAGFDVMAGDPLGGMLLEPEDVHALTREIVDQVEDGVGIVAALEGGYDPARTGIGTAQVLRALAGIDLGAC